MINKKISKRKKKTWSLEEDNLLIKIVNQNGPYKWSDIASKLEGRLGKQCRERWHNHLNPNINKSQWTFKEEWILFLLHKIYGNSWANISQNLVSRTDNTIKNHWNSIMKRKIDNFEILLKETINNKENYILSELEIELINKIHKGDFEIKNKKVIINNSEEKIVKTPDNNKNIEQFDLNTFYKRLHKNSNQIEFSSNEKKLLFKSPTNSDKFFNSNLKNENDFFENFNYTKLNLDEVYNILE